MNISLVPLMAFARLTIAIGSSSAAADGPNKLNDGNDSSDSDVDTSAISEAATNDAQDFFATQNSKKWDEAALNIGLAHAVKNGYEGQAAYLYAAYFYVACNALYKDQ